MIVADCTLLAYLLLEGDHTAEAEEVFRRDPEWCAPFLWRSEIRNVFTKYILHRGLPLEEALAKMEEAEALLGHRSFAINSSHVLEEAVRKRLSAYDAEYLTLAIQLQIPLITFDRQLLSSCPNSAFSATDFLKQQF